MAQQDDEQRQRDAGDEELDGEGEGERWLEFEVGVRQATDEVLVDVPIIHGESLHQAGDQRLLSCARRVAELPRFRSGQETAPRDPGKLDAEVDGKDA